MLSGLLVAMFDTEFHLHGSINMGSRTDKQTAMGPPAVKYDRQGYPFTPVPNVTRTDKMLKRGHTLADRRPDIASTQPFYVSS
jgi:hypothetical protein